MHFNAVHGRRAVGWHDFEKLVSTVKFELQCLEDNIYHHWLTELKQRLSKMAVPAIIESQSLPGFIVNENNRFFNKLLSGSNQPAFSTDNLLTFMNRVNFAMKCYYVEPFVMEQGLTELLKLIGVTAFNDLVMRRNFNSWKRGKLYCLCDYHVILRIVQSVAMQIQYNITRLEEWCKGHEMGEAVIQLEHLMQAAKLLQLKKSSLDDIKIIYDVCWLLTPTQVQKLVQNYIVADYEDPISNEILRAVASRVSSSDSNDILLLDNVSLDDSPYEVPEPQLVVANTYLPSYVSCLGLFFLPCLTCSLITAQAETASAVDGPNATCESEPKTSATRLAIKPIYPVIRPLNSLFYCNISPVCVKIVPCKRRDYIYIYMYMQQFFIVSFSLFFFCLYDAGRWTACQHLAR